MLLSPKEFLESDYLNLANAQWVQQLFYSPQVYIMGQDYTSPIDRQDKIYKDYEKVNPRTRPSVKYMYKR